MIAMLAALAAVALQKQPIIDMHFHAYSADALGSPGVAICAPYDHWPIRDPANPISDYLDRFTVRPKCRRAFFGPKTNSELRDRAVAQLRRLNILAVASGPQARVADFYRAAPQRIIPALEIDGDALPAIADLRTLHAKGMLNVIGEILAQYSGMAPDDPRLEPYYALAEELDVPVAIHIGPGPPGVSYFASPKYRMRLSNPLALEEVLVRHPKLRLYVMHAGWPMADEMIALLYAHPQVYVDTGVIDYAFPRAEFHAYLKRLVDAGFEKRIMFGSDEMVWPEAIGAAIEGITTARFLTETQKRDILYNNAARFLKLTRGGGSPD